MKKKFIGVSLILVIVFSLCACGKKSSDIEYDPFDYVKLGQYEGVEVTLNKSDYEVTDEKIEEEMISLCLPSSDFVPDDTQTVVKEDSIVNVDYTGSVNGKEFQGGSAQNVWIDVKNNCDAESSTSYIEGFSKGLVGAIVGTTAISEVTFPKDYQASDLAGKDAKFEFKINSIAKQLTIEQITDDYLKENTEYTSVEQLREVAKSSLESELQMQKTKDTRKAVIDVVQANATFTGLPEEVVDLKIEEYLDSYKKAYVKSGSLEKNLKEVYGISLEEFKESVKEDVSDNLKTQIVYEAIAKEKNIEVDESGFEEYCKKIALANGFESVENLYKAYGIDKDKESGEKYLKNVYLCNKALDYCVEKAIIKEL